MTQLGLFAGHPVPRSARPLSRRARAARQLARGAALGLCLLLARPAAAQPRPEDRAAAEGLFSEARRLLRRGEYAEACAKLEASRQLEPALGTSLNLADCYEKLGRSASAWAEFKSAAAEAQRAGDTARKAVALERAAALEPRLCRLLVRSAEPGVNVRQNGEQMSPAVLGNAIPIDPGSYRFEARAPGKAVWSRSVEIAGEGALVEVLIPALDSAPSPRMPAPLEAEPEVPAPPARRADGGPRALAWTLGGVGVVALGTGAVFGALASTSWSKAKQRCGDYPYECTRAGLDEAQVADTRADLATAAFIVGGAALGSAAVLFVVSGAGSRGAELAVGSDRVLVQGRF